MCLENYSYVQRRSLRQIMYERDYQGAYKVIENKFTLVDTWIRVNDPSAGSPTER